MFSFGHCPNLRGGGRPLPERKHSFFGRCSLGPPKHVLHLVWNFLAPFFYQVTVLKNFTVIVCFLVIFVIIIIKITKIIIIIIIETIIIIIKKNFGHTRKTSFLTSKKEDQVARIGVRGGGLGDSGNARKKTFFCY